MISSIAQLLNLLLEILLWLIIGRYALKVISFGRKTFVSEIFRVGTDPWFALVRRITPLFVPDVHIPILGVLLIVNLKILLGLIVAWGI